MVRKVYLGQNFELRKKKLLFWLVIRYWWLVIGDSWFVIPIAIGSDWWELTIGD
jgi:hypothetical protein